MRGNAHERLSARIRELEQRLARLRTLQSTLNDPELAGEIEELFGGHMLENKNGLDTRERAPSTQRLVDFFRSHDNQHATVSMLVEQTGVGKNTIRQILYKTGAELFERESHRGGGQESLFWLKEAVMNDTKS